MSDQDGQISNVGRAAGLAGEILKIASENDNAREAGVIAGDSIKIISQALRNALLPLAAVNYGIAKFEQYVRTKFQDDLSAKLTSVPVQNLEEPRLSIAGPLMSGLAYVHEEDELRELFLQLLASSMDGRVNRNVHPAFVEIVRQLDSREAQVLRQILRLQNLPIVEIRTIGDVYQVCARNVTYFVQNPPLSIADDPLPSYIDNWVRLGIVEVSFSEYFTEPGVYEWVSQCAVFQECRSTFGDVTYAQGSLRVTDWGRRFRDVVVTVPA